MFLCPRCGRATQPIEKRFRCLYCSLHSKLSTKRSIAYVDWLPFQGSAVQLAHTYHGLTTVDLAAQLGVDVAYLEAIEAGQAIVSPDLARQIAFATGFPLAFFHIEHVRFEGPTTLDWHAEMARCECGYCLGMEGDPLPVICPACYAVVEGCPRCDQDLEANWRYDKAGQISRVTSIYCPACGWKRTTNKQERALPSQQTVKQMTFMEVE
jgi:transcriptional regulator with XRE-family HTH domain